MKTNLFFFLTLIICSQTFATLFQSKETTMEYLLSELAELNGLAGKSKISVEALITKIRDSVQDANKSLKKTVGSIVERGNKGSDVLGKYIKKLVGDMKADEARISQVQDKLKKSTVEVAKYRKELGVSTAKIEKLNVRIRKERVNCHKHIDEIVQKLDTIKRLEDIINDELLQEEQKKQAPAAAPRSSNNTRSGNNTGFVQINDAFAELKEKLGNEQDIMISPLVSALLSIASSKRFSNQAILHKILTLTAKIAKNLREFEKKETQTCSKIQVELKKQIQSVVEQHRNLFKLYFSAAATVKYQTKLIQNLKFELQMLSRHIQTKQQERKRWDATNSATNRYYNQCVGEYNKALGAVKALLEAVSH